MIKILIAVEMKDVLHVLTIMTKNDYFEEFTCFLMQLILGLPPPPLPVHVINNTDCLKW